MHLAVYGKAARAGVYLVRDALRRLGIRQNADSIKFTRDVIKTLPPDHYLHACLNKSGGVESDVSIVETLLHPQDRAYSFPEVIAFVERCGLSFAGWRTTGFIFRIATFLRKPPLGGSSQDFRSRSMGGYRKPKSTMITHAFFACHRERRLVQIDFSREDWPSFVPSIHPAESTVIAGDKCKVRRAGISVNLNDAGRFFWSQVNSSRSISNILSLPSLATNSDIDRMIAGREFYSRMWRLGHLFFSTPTGPPSDKKSVTTE